MSTILPISSCDRLIEYGSFLNEFLFYYIFPIPYFIIFYNQYNIKSVRKLSMNKSIMKTRNELQRITYKINQLKNKYAGENQSHPLPKNQPKDNRIQLCMQQENDNVLRSKNLLSNTQSHNSKYPSSQKQSKYQHTRHDERDMTHSHRKSVPVVPAILQISNHNSYESNQNNDLVNSKSLSNFKSQIFAVLDHTISAKIKAIYGGDNNERQRALEERLMEFIKGKMDNKILLTDSECNTESKCSERKDNKLEQLQNRFAEIQHKLQKVVKGQQMDLQEKSRTQSQLKTLLQKMGQQIDQQNRQITRERQRMECNDRKVGKLQEIVEGFDLCIKQLKAKEGQPNHQVALLNLEEQVRSVNIKVQELQKQNHEYSQTISKIQSGSRTNESTLAELSLQLNKIKASCGHLSSQLSRVLHTEQKTQKLGGQLQHITNQIGNLSQFYQQNQTKFEELSLQIQNTSLNMASPQLSTLISQKIASLQPNINSQPHISQPIINYIEDQLNQFEADVNQTIKLLYDDIENKVNQMVSGQSSEVQNNRTMQTIQNLRQQLSLTVGTQMDRLGNIMEKTVEEIEIKMEKLDHNFAYVYDRMSKIEYDNALFKDQLTVKGKCIETEKDRGIDRKQEDGSLLNILGSLSNGKQISTLGIIQ